MSSFIFTHAALTEIAVLLDKVESPDDLFAGVDDLARDPAQLLTLPIALSAPDPLLVGKRAQEGLESENARLVYEYVGVGDRVNRADPRLWSYLAFVTYRDYMRERWPLDGLKDWKKRVQERWLLTASSRERLVRHGIARLWWLAHLNWDHRKERPLSRETDDSWAYVHVVLSNEDRVQTIFERQAGSNTELRFAILDHLAASESRSSGRYVKELMKALRAESGVREMRVCPPAVLRRIVDEVGEGVQQRLETL